MTHGDAPPIDRTSLYSLSCAYASGADSGDAERFLSAFEPDAVLTVPGPPARDIRGSEELSAVPARLGHYERTFHLLGQASYERVDDHSAHGVVHCVAHHLSVGEHGSHDLVWLIRYHDDYRLTPRGWRIRHRTLDLQWTEDRPANPPPLPGTR